METADDIEEAAKEDRKATQLQRGYGAVCPVGLFYCPQHPKKVGVVAADQHSKYDWALSLTCSDCSNRGNYTICIKCCSVRTAFKSMRDINSHDRAKHQDDTPGKEPAVLSMGTPKSDRGTKRNLKNLYFFSDEDNDDESGYVQEYEHGTKMSKALLGWEKARFNFTSDASNQFFRHVLMGQPRAVFMVRNAFQLLDNARMTLQEITFHLNTAKLCSTLTQTQRSQLADCYANVNLLLENVSRTRTSSKWATFIPRATKEVRKYYCDGKNSILQSLPCPTVSMFKDHAFISLREAVSHALGFGIDLCPEPEHKKYHNSDVQNHMSDSKFGRELLGEICRTKKGWTADRRKAGHLMVFIMLWTDGFESRNVLNNRGSTHCVNATIIGEGHNDIRNSYVLAISHDKADHNEYYMHLKEEIENLNNLFAEGHSWLVRNSEGHKTFEQVAVKLMAVLQDQPERRKALGLMAGNSTYTTRFGWRGNWKYSAMKDKLVACDHCLHRWLTNDLGYPNYFRNLDGCEADSNKCRRWKQKDMMFPAPAGYPNQPPPIHSPYNSDSYCSDVEGNDPHGVYQIRSRQLKFYDLIYAVEMCWDNYLDRRWSRKHIVSFLLSYGIHEDVASKIFRNGDKILALKSSFGVQRQDLLADKAHNPSHYVRYDGPAMWFFQPQSVKLHSHPDTPMHLLFHGIVKTIVTSWIPNWIKLRRKGAAFEHDSKPKLNVIASFNLSWMVMQPFTGGKLGGWQAVQYVAFSKVLPWFYGWLDCLTDDKPYQEPIMDQQMWPKRKNIEWCKAHGVQYDKTMTAVQLREFVRLEKMKKPVLLGPNGPSASDVMLMVRSLSTMIGHLMVTPYDPQKSERPIRDSIRVFLTLFARVEEDMIGALPPKFKKSSGSSTGTTQVERLPTWVTSFNFASLLNLPDIISQYGALSNLWEGSFKGEGILPSVKRNVVQGQKGNWEENTLRRVHQERAFKEVMRDWNKTPVVDSYNDTADDENGAPVNIERNMYYKYKDCESVVEAFQKADPLMVVQCASRFGEVWCCVTRDGCCIPINQMVSVDRGSIRKNGLQYFYFRLLNYKDQGNKDDELCCHAQFDQYLKRDKHAPVEENPPAINFAKGQYLKDLFSSITRAGLLLPVPLKYCDYANKWFRLYALITDRYETLDLSGNYKVIETTIVPDTFETDYVTTGIPYLADLTRTSFFFSAVIGTPYLPKPSGLRILDQRMRERGEEKNKHHIAQCPYGVGYREEHQKGVGMGYYSPTHDSSFFASDDDSE